jgi:hypothetical protein
MLPYERYPNRVKKATRAAVEIVRTVGWFGPQIGEGRPFRAELADFNIIFFTPFNRPSTWIGIDWQDIRIRHSLYGLSISYDAKSCLSLVWDQHWRQIRWFRNPVADDWDRRLRDLRRELVGPIASPFPIPDAIGLLVN